MGKETNASTPMISTLREKAKKEVYMLILEMTNYSKVVKLSFELPIFLGRAKIAAGILVFGGNIGRNFLSKNNNLDIYTMPYINELALVCTILESAQWHILTKCLTTFDQCVSRPANRPRDAYF